MGKIPHLLEVDHCDAWFSDINIIKHAFLGTKLENNLTYGLPLKKARMYIAGSKNLSKEIVQAYQRIYKQLGK